MRLLIRLVVFPAFVYALLLTVSAFPGDRRRLRISNWLPRCAVKSHPLESRLFEGLAEIAIANVSR